MICEFEIIEYCFVAAKSQSLGGTLGRLELEL